MLSAIDKSLVNGSVRYSAELNLLYLNNPKAACSTIKYSLWLAIDDLNGKPTFGGNIHGRDGDPFATDVFALKPDQAAKIARAVVFSVVRNPFSRTLAAYLEKIPDDPVVWTVFRKRLGLRQTVTKEDLPFSDFVRLLAAAPDGLLDGHFRPQSDNLLLPHSTPAFIGNLENFQLTGRFLREWGIPLRDERGHATGSSERLARYYDSRSIDIVREKYASDFALFGYSGDLSDRDRVTKTYAVNRESGDDLILRWIATGEAPAGASETSKTIAIFTPATDRDKTLKLIGTTLARENNWSRLRRFARFVGRTMPESELRDRIRGKMATLRSKYEEAVTNPAIFVESLRD